MDLYYVFLSLNKLVFSMEWIFPKLQEWKRIRLNLAISTYNQWKVFDLYVKYAFMNGMLQEAVYVQTIWRIHY